MLTADLDSLDTEPYWDPERLLESASISPADAAEHFRELFSQAIERMLTVTTVSLSGGVDSPPIAAYANREYARRWDRRVPALSAVYPSFRKRREPVHRARRRTPRAPAAHALTCSQRLDRVQFWLKLFDGPWSTWLRRERPSAAEQARALGFTTILSGEFAEQVSALRPARGT